MDEQNKPQLNEPAQNLKTIWIIIISVVITALVVGGGVYAWQNFKLKSTVQNLQQQIISLQNQTTKLEKELPIINNNVDKIVTELEKELPIINNNVDKIVTEKNDWKNYFSNLFKAVYSPEETPKTSGKYSFNYPNEFEAIYSSGSMEGCTFSEKINFAIPLKTNSNNLKTFNDLSIETYWYSGPADHDPERRCINEVYTKKCLEPVSNSNGKDIKVGNATGKIWENLGGMVSNPSVICIKKDQYFTIVEREKDISASSINDDIFKKIISSFKFE